MPASRHREITAYGWPRGMREPVAAEYVGLGVSSLRADASAPETEIGAHYAAFAFGPQNTGGAFSTFAAATASSSAVSIRAFPLMRRTATGHRSIVRAETGKYLCDMIAAPAARLTRAGRFEVSGCAIIRESTFGA
jgi:hypothetical protein